MPKPKSDLKALGEKLMDNNTPSFGDLTLALIDAEDSAEDLGLSPRRLAIIRSALESALIHAYAGQHEDQKELPDAG